MKQIKMTTAVILIIVVAVVTGVSVYAASLYGTSSDPLITKSYLDETLTPSLIERMSQDLDSAVASLRNSISEGNRDELETYEVISLAKGQTLKGSVGCEVLLRSGSATVSAAASPGLLNITAGDSISNGASLSANNMYMFSVDGNGVVATSETALLMVRGAYSIS